MLTTDTLSLNIQLLKGLASLGDRITPYQNEHRLKIGRVSIAMAINPTITSLDPNQRILYIAQIKLLCPELFN